MSLQIEKLPGIRELDASNSIDAFECPEFFPHWPIVYDENRTRVVISGYSPLTVNTGLALYILGCIQVFVSAVVYLWRRRTNVFLQKRGDILIVIIAIGLFPALHAAQYREWIGRHNYPCLAYLVGQMAPCATFYAPYIIRSYVLYYRYRYKRLQLLFWQQQQGDRGEHESFGEKQGSQNRKNVRVTQAMLNRARKESTDSRALQLLVLSAVIVAIPTVVVVVSKPEFLQGCTGCENGMLEMVILIVFDIVMSSLTFLGVWSLRNEKDPLRLIAELRLTLGLNLCIVQPALVLTIMDPGNLMRDGLWHWQHLAIVGQIIMHGVTVPYQVYRSFRRKARTVEARYLGLDTFLHEQEARSFFTTYLLSEFSAENYYFWEEAFAWKHEDFDSSEARVEAAKKICSTFVLPGSPLEINIEWKTRKTIVEEIAKEYLKEVSTEFFDKASKEVYDILMVDSFPRFKKSEMYETYLRTYGTPDENLVPVKAA